MEGIARDLREQYTIAYRPTNPARDGHWRRVVVRTPARVNLDLRHKLGYFAPKT